MSQALRIADIEASCRTQTLDPYLRDGAFGTTPLGGVYIDLKDYQAVDDHRVILRIVTINGQHKVA